MLGMVVGEFWGGGGWSERWTSHNNICLMRSFRVMAQEMLRRDDDDLDFEFCLHPSFPVYIVSDVVY